MSTDVAQILRQIDRGAVRDADDLVIAPDAAAALLIGHLKLFLDQLIGVTYGMRPGRQRLMLTMEVYWEGSFRRRHLRSRCIELIRDREAALRQVADCGEQIGKLIYVEMKACGIEHLSEFSRDFMRRVRDVARQELEADTRLPALRQTQYEWLDALCHRAQYRGLGPFILR
ncbi:MAG TPA: hypothetical protein VGE57_05340 [Solimonas sp.]